jgi:hypothetical protein
VELVKHADMLVIVVMEVLVVEANVNVATVNIKK